MYSHFLYKELIAPVSLKCKAQVRSALSVNENGNMIFIKCLHAVYILPLVCSLVL